MLELTLDGLIDGQAGRTRERLVTYPTRAAGATVVEWATQHQGGWAPGNVPRSSSGTLRV